MRLQSINLGLNYNWKWKQRNEEVASVWDEVDRGAWRKAESVPSEIHVELLKAGLIPDPFVGFSEHKVQCESSY